MFLTYVHYTDWNWVPLIMFLGDSSLTLEITIIIPETEVFE